MNTFQMYPIFDAKLPYNTFTRRYEAMRASLCFLKHVEEHEPKCRTEEDYLNNSKLRHQLDFSEEINCLITIQSIFINILRKRVVIQCSTNLVAADNLTLGKGNIIALA